VRDELHFVLNARADDATLTLDDVEVMTGSALGHAVVRGGLGSVDLNALRAIIFSGEVFPPKYLFRLHAAPALSAP
jgi:hypothetical protein